MNLLMLALFGGFSFTGSLISEEVSGSGSRARVGSGEEGVEETGESEADDDRVGLTFDLGFVSGSEVAILTGFFELDPKFSTRVTLSGVWMVKLPSEEPSPLARSSCSTLL